MRGGEGEGEVKQIIKKKKGGGGRDKNMQLKNTQKKKI